MKVYVANDVEAAGSRLGLHSTLSLGACVITRENLTFDQYRERGLIFYAELKPHSMLHEKEAMRVGCLHLECLEKMRQSDYHFDPTHSMFHPELVLRYMQRACEEPSVAINRFAVWLKKVAGENEVVGVTDTTFFDAGHINFLFGSYFEGSSPYKWRGLDLKSIHCGYTGKEDAILGNLSVEDDREKPHRADHDAVFLARQGRVLLYEKMGW